MFSQIDGRSTTASIENCESLGDILYQKLDIMIESIESKSFPCFSVHVSNFWRIIFGIKYQLLTPAFNVLEVGAIGPGTTMAVDLFGQNILLFFMKVPEKSYGC